MSDRAQLRQWRDSAAEQTASLGLALQLARKATDLSLRTLSERSGVRTDIIQRAERGVWVLDAEQLDAIVDALIAARH